MPMLRAGERWGHVLLTARRTTPEYSKGPGGKDYISDSQGGPVMLDLKCDCGYQWSVTEMDFTGKRAMRNCGRPQCEFASELEREAIGRLERAKKAGALGGSMGYGRGSGRGRPRGEECRCVSLYLPARLVDLLSAKAWENRTSLSKTVAEHLDMGLAYQELQDSPAGGDIADTHIGLKGVREGEGADSES